ncbi:hypothetical protein CKM354_001041000 [Cercospora kikuchii]|uniref:DUF7730 domain-containing protein n=1 Tax=Cercospora kikuchii TaxID=84275 RepID=A0A9P3CV85_9PEZI|nr:uncharacterized protein CKM354_001041000 [Cercospora kikuchii]GIZ47315.1 hypothetical protein CKM354_001041000 [Cercospora kikuchii]
MAYNEHNAATTAGLNSQVAVIASLTTQTRSSALVYQPTPEPPPLRDEVLQLVGPWRDSSEPPPFTRGELVVIALILIDDGPVALEEVHRKIYQTFGHYRDQALSEYLRPVYVQKSSRTITCSDLPHHTQARGMEILLGSTMRDLDLPLKRSAQGEQKFYLIDRKAARIYLQCWLEPPRQETFDFFGLPAELREHIYKMVTGSPEAGLKNVGIGRVVISASEDIPLALEKISRASVLFRVCKQIYFEAMPVFYHNNTLEFDSIDTLLKVLRRMSTKTMEEIRILHIAVLATGTDCGGLSAFLPHIFPAKVVLHVVSAGFQGRMMRGKSEEENLRRFDQSLALQEVADLANRAASVEVKGDGFLLSNWFRKKIKKTGT